MTKDDKRILKRQAKELLGHIEWNNYQVVKRLAANIIKFIEEKEGEKKE